jgi:hemolysin activation/secretion protein
MANYYIKKTMKTFQPASIVVLGLFLCQDNAYPQRYEAGIRETDRPVKEKIERKIMTAPKKPPAITEEPIKPVLEGPKIFVKKIELIGVESFNPEDFNPITEKYKNRDVYFSEIKDMMAKEIERDYLKRGVIAACFVPPQEVKDGIVKVRVVEAKLGSVKVNKPRYFRQDRIAYNWSTEKGKVLRYDRISRDLQLANKNPDREVKATLLAGELPETTDVMLEAKTKFPFHVTGTFDREGVPATGKARAGIGFVENNMLGLEDTVIAGYTGGLDFGGTYLYQKVPVTAFGTTLLYGLSQTKSFPKKDYTIYGLSATSQEISVAIYQDLYTKSVYRGDVYLGIDAKNKHVVATSGTVANDRLRELQGGISLLERGTDDVTYVKGDFSQGLNFLGALRRNEYSSRDAGNVFLKLTGTAQYRKALPKGFQASAKISGQLSTIALTPEEEFYMGGIDSVRGYPSGDFLADNGFVANLELTHNASFIPDWVRFPYGQRPIGEEMMLVGFFDYGYGMKRSVQQGELGKRKMAGAGVGVRVNLLDQATLRLEWGFVLDTMANMPYTQFDRQRLHFSIDFQDKMPEEIERFQKLYREDYIKESAWKMVNLEMKNPDSLLRQKIYEYLSEADRYYAAGDLKSARKYYEKVETIGMNAHRQAEAYIRECYEQIDGLNKDISSAEVMMREGSYDKAKETLQKVKESAQPKQLFIKVI